MSHPDDRHFTCPTCRGNSFSTDPGSGDLGDNGTRAQWTAVCGQDDCGWSGPHDGNVQRIDTDPPNALATGAA